MPAEITPLDKLASVGSHALGALVYEPEYEITAITRSVNLDLVASQVQEVFKGTSEEILQRLLALNGSSVGARPKALIGVSHDHKQVTFGEKDFDKAYNLYLVKFPNTQDGIDSGAVEYVYALMAKEAGIAMPDVHLFPAKDGPGYFAARCFDCEGTRRYHMHSVSGLLHADFRVPSLDYQDLLTLTFTLTRDIREVEKMYRLAVFNVLSHNRDDHAKNFSFLMDAKGEWRLSGAYDLTFSAGPGGEQSTMVMGEGRNPTEAHLTQLVLEAKLTKQRISEIIEQARSALANWTSLAKQYGVSESMVRIVVERMNRIQ